MVYNLKPRACTRKENVHVAVCSEFLRTRDDFRDLGVDWKVIFTLILHKRGVRVWKELKCGTTWHIGRLRRIMWGTIRCHKNVNFLHHLNKVSTASFRPVLNKVQGTTRFRLLAAMFDPSCRLDGSLRRCVVPNSIQGTEYDERDGFFAVSFSSSRKIAYWKSASILRRMTLLYFTAFQFTHPQ